MVLWSYPRHALTDKYVEHCRRDRDRLFQRLFRLVGPAELAERSCEPTVALGVFRIFPDHLFCHLHRGLVLPAKVKAQRDLVQTYRPLWATRIEPDAFLKRRNARLWATREDQSRTEHPMRMCEIWTHLERGLRLGETTVKVAPPIQNRGQSRAGLGIGRIERDRLTDERLDLLRGFGR